MKILIKEISADKTYALRHPLLREGRPIESCAMEGDDHSHTIHLGAYLDGRLIGILSAMPNSCAECLEQSAYQLRGIAVIHDLQGRGVAKTLIYKAIEILCDRYKTKCIWLNARIAAQTLYLATGFIPIGAQFEIEPIGKHQRFVKFFTNES